MSLTNDQITAKNFKVFYEAIRPYLNSGIVGPAMVKLYDGTIPTNLNSNTISSSSDMVELSESIERFNFIYIHFTSHINSGDNNATVGTDSLTPVALIKDNYTAPCIEQCISFNGNQYYTRQSFGFYDATHLAKCWENYAGWAHNTNDVVVYGVAAICSDTVATVDINKPNTWTANTEYYFGDGVYGQRFTGTMTATANTILYTNLQLYTSKVYPISYGGYWGGPAGALLPFGFNHPTVDQKSDVIFNLMSDTIADGYVQLRTQHTSARTDIPYEFWALYTKGDES